MLILGEVIEVKQMLRADMLMLERSKGNRDVAPIRQSCVDPIRSQPSVKFEGRYLVTVCSPIDNM